LVRLGVIEPAGAKGEQVRFSNQLGFDAG